MKNISNNIISIEHHPTTQLPPSTHQLHLSYSHFFRIQARRNRRNAGRADSQLVCANCGDVEEQVCDEEENVNNVYVVCAELCCVCGDIE